MGADEIVTEITVVPDGADVEDRDVSSWSVKVVWRGGGRYAVLARGQCLARSGEWEHEHIPSERTEAWLKEHRFALEEALRLAHVAANTMVVSSKTWVQVLAWREEHQR